MKNAIRIFSLLLAVVCTLFVPACVDAGTVGDSLAAGEGNAAHTHEFSLKNVCDDCFAEEATCAEPAKYYYSCECGEKGTETFDDGEALGHLYTVQNTDERYLMFEAGCAFPATYYYSCERCDDFDTHQIFEYGEINQDLHISGRSVDYVYINDDNYTYVTTCNGCDTVVHESDLISICHDYVDGKCKRCGHTFDHKDWNDDIHCYNSDNVCVGFGCGLGCAHSVDSSNTCSKCGTFFWGHESEWIDGMMDTYWDKQ